MTAGTPARSAHSSGFTLVELLVALFIFSLISVAGVGLLRSSSDSQLAIKEKLTGQAAISRTANLLEADLAQAVARNVRDVSGGSRAAFSDGSGEQGALFAFSRTGLNSGGDNSHPSVGRVAYGFANGALTRTSWPMADGSEANEAAPLIKDLREASIRFRGDNGSWRTDWSALDAKALPRAVELTLTPNGGAPYRLVMLVGSQLRTELTGDENDDAL